MFNFSDALDIVTRDFAKGVNDNPIIAITMLPVIINADTAGIPNNATAPPNTAVVAAIIPTCLNETSFVASTIFLI